MLFEELASKFGLQTLQPFKEPVIAIPVREFKNEWREPLEREGCKILLSDFLGRSCFLVRKPQPSNNSALPVNEPKQNEQPNVEESIVQLIKEGCGFNQIRERLGLSHAELMGHLSSLKRKGVLDRLGWVSVRRKQAIHKPKVEGAPNNMLGENGLTVKELLEASLKLIEPHPKVAKMLLQKASEML